MKKALIVSTIFGFIASFERSDVRILQEMGYEVHCACDSVDYTRTWKTDDLLQTGIIVHNIPFTRNPISESNRRAYRELKQLMEREKFDLVHCHTPVGGALGRMAARKCGVPAVLYTAHGFHFYKGAPIRNKLLYYPVEKTLARFTDILITINGEDYETARKKLRARRTERIHGVGIDIGRFVKNQEARERLRTAFGIRDGETALISVGVLDGNKNHRAVLEAMKTLAPEGYRYLIVGKGELKEEYDAFIRENGLENAVTLAGYRQDIPEILQAADMCVYPSLREGLPVGLMEAVASRLPVACSRVRGNVDVVVTEESYFDPRDPASVTAAIRRIGRMAEDRKAALTEKNYRNLLAYDMTEVRKEMTAIYREADRLTRGVRSENRTRGK